MSIWPKNIVFYRRGEQSLASMEAALAKHPSKKPEGLAWFSQGWVKPAAFVDELSPRYGQYRLVNLKRIDKVLPGAVIKAAHEEKIAQIEAREHRVLGRKEKKSLKEQVVDELLPKALTKDSATYAWMNDNFIVINAGTHNKAENVLGMLREALPPFPCALPRTKAAPGTVMTQWLLDGSAGGLFELGADVNMQDSTTEGAKVTVRRGDLTADDVRKHIESGKQVTSMSLIWNERIRFTLTDNMLLKSIKYLDVMKEELNGEGEDQSALFEATFRLVSSDLANLVSQLVAELGGYED